MREKVLVVNEIPKGRFKRLYEKFSKYSYRVPRVRKYRNVFISHEGIALKRFLLIGGTAFNISGFRDKNFYLNFWKTVVIQFLVCKYGRSLVSTRYKERKYTIIHSKWFNYGFWINSSLSRLIHLEEKGYLKDTVLLLPESIYSKEFVKDTLSVFDVEIELIRSGTHLFIENYIHVESRDYSTEFYSLDIDRVRKRLREKALVKGKIEGKDFSKVYLSRKEDRNIRLVVNHKEFEKEVLSKGFVKVNFEDYSVWQQIYIMSMCREFISIHGAGCTNILFMSESSIFIELINREYSQLEYQFPFWKLSKQSGLNYKSIFCQSDNSNSKSLTNYGKYGGEYNEKDFLVNHNLIVPINILKELL